MTNPIAYTNDIGQTINPGDEVVIVTTGYSHSVSTNKATYLGLHTNGGAQCVKKVKTSYYAFKDTGERVPYTFFQEKNKRLDIWIREYREKNPGKYGYYNEPEYKALRAEAMDKVEMKYEYVDRRTTLKLNRIYKLAA